MTSWREWIRTLRRQIGMVDLADVIYVHSEYYWQRKQCGARGRPGSTRIHERATRPAGTDPPRMVGPGQCRNPLRRPRGPHRPGQSQKRSIVSVLIAAPTTGLPRSAAGQSPDKEQALLPQLARRLEQLETRLKIIEEEQRGGLDLTKFYERPATGRIRR